MIADVAFDVCFKLESTELVVDDITLRTKFDVVSVLPKGSLLVVVFSAPSSVDFSFPVNDGKVCKRILLIVFIFLSTVEVVLVAGRNIDVDMDDKIFL